MLPLFTTILPLVTDNSFTDENIFSIETFCTMGDSVPLYSGKLSFLDQQHKWNHRNDVEEHAEQIENFDNLEVLELRGNTLGVQAGERIAEALEEHPELERCLFSDLFTGRLKTEIPPILKSLCNAMMTANAQIVELDLSDNAFGPIGAEGIQDFLVSPSAFFLQTLKLNNNGLGAGGKVIARCLSECYDNAKKNGQTFRLKTFIAGRNRLEDPGACALSEAFQKIGTLEEIAVPQNGIRMKGIKALARAFERNRGLKVINLNDNTCTAEGGLAVAESLEFLKHLEVLDLGDCLCRDTGGIAVIASIVDGHYPNLKSVNLSGNELTPDAGFFALEGWEEAGLEASLSLSTNNFGSVFDDMKSSVEQSEANIDVGNESEDEGSLDPPSDVDEDEEEEEEEEEDDDTEEDEDNYDEEEVEKEQQHSAGDQDIASVLSGFGCMKVEESAPPAVNFFNASQQVSDEQATLSFLDQQLKWNSRAEAEPTAVQIENKKVLRILELRGNTLGIEAGERIAEALKKHPELQRCLWSDLFTGRLKTEIPPILKSLCNAMMTSNAQIVELDLSDNAFGPIGAEGIQDFLVSSSAFSLQVLKLNNNGLGAGGKVIAASLLECHKRSTVAGRPLQLKVFVAGRNRLEVPGATALAEAFKAIGTLEEVTVHQNGITAKGVAALAAAFKVNRNLRVININDNTATEEGSRAIAEALPSLHKLESLQLGDCLCRDSGCHSIIDALNPFTHMKLKEVNLSGSEMTGNAALLIGKKFEKFGGKATMKIESNNFGDMFHEVKGTLPQYIDCGDSEDDQGSLSDDGEYQSDVTDSEDEEENERENIPQSGDVSSVLLPKMEELREAYESRTQEETAAIILKLVEVVAKNPLSIPVFNKAVEIADDIIVCVEASRRRPIPPSTQLINQLISQAGFNVKPEFKLVPSVDKTALHRLLEALQKKGRFLKEADTIKFFFNPVAKPVQKGPFAMNFNFGSPQMK